LVLVNFISCLPVGPVTVFAFIILDILKNALGLIALA